MSKRAVSIAFFLLAQFLSGQRSVHACSCASAPVCSAFYTADAVFTAVARVSTPEIRRGEQRTTFVIERSFRGPAEGRIEVISRDVGFGCDFGFTDGTKYLVYARNEPNGESWSVFLCSRTRPVSSASEDLEFLEWVVRHPEAGGAVRGNAFVVEPIPKTRLRRVVRKLTGVTVTLTGPDLLRTHETDIQGNYEFRDVPPGDYQLGFRLSPAFVPVASVRVEIKGPGGCAQHSFSAFAVSTTK